MCLTADMCLTEDPGVVFLIPVRCHTFVELDHEIVSMAILLPSLVQEGLLSVTSKSVCTKYWLTAKSIIHRKKVCPGMTIAVDWDIKHQTKQIDNLHTYYRLHTDD